MEKWTPVVGFEGLYEISDLGRIRTVKEGRKCPAGHIMSPKLGKWGYLYVNLWRNGLFAKVGKIHRLVAIAFIPNPENKSDVNHKNGVKTDNHLENLEWATEQENVIHAFATGLHSGLKMRGEKNGYAKLSEADIPEIFELRELGWTHQKIADKFGVCRAHIGLVLSKKTWAWKH